MDIQQIVTTLGLSGLMIYATWRLGEFMVKSSRESVKEAQAAAKNIQDNNKDSAELWAALFNKQMEQLNANVEALRALSERVNDDRDRREEVTKQQAIVSEAIKDALIALSARVDAESVSIRDSYAASTERLERIATIATTAVATAAEAVKGVQIMSETQQSKHEHIVEMLTNQGLKVDRINEIIDSADVLTTGGLETLETRLAKAISADTVAQLLRAMADTQPIVPVAPDGATVIQNVTVNPETKEETNHDQP